MSDHCRNLQPWKCQASGLRINSCYLVIHEIDLIDIWNSPAFWRVSSLQQSRTSFVPLQPEAVVQPQQPKGIDKRYQACEGAVLDWTHWKKREKSEKERNKPCRTHGNCRVSVPLWGNAASSSTLRLRLCCRNDFRLWCWFALGFVLLVAI